MENEDEKISSSSLNFHILKSEALYFNNKFM